jgi:hypothetical protein
MDPISIALLALRVAAGLISPQAAKAVDLLSASFEAGHNIDAHLAAVAAALKSGQPVDWDDLTSRIQADSADLHSPRPG